MCVCFKIERIKYEARSEFTPFVKSENVVEAKASEEVTKRTHKMNQNDAHVHTCTPPQLLAVPDPFLSVTCLLIARNPCTDQWRLCYLLVGNCPLHQYSACAGSGAASPGVLLMSLMRD